MDKKYVVHLRYTCVVYSKDEGNALKEGLNCFARDNEIHYCPFEFSVERAES